MQARIYRPAKSAMQSGRANARGWVVEFDPAKPKEIDPLMGWVGSRDTRGQIRLRFASRDAAVAYAKREGLDYRVIEAKPARPLPAKNYSDNFRFDKVS